MRLYMQSLSDDLTIRNSLRQGFQPTNSRPSARGHWRTEACLGQPFCSQFLCWKAFVPSEPPKTNGNGFVLPDVFPIRISISGWLSKTLDFCRLGSFCGNSVFRPHSPGLAETQNSARRASGIPPRTARNLPVERNLLRCKCLQKVSIANNGAFSFCFRMARPFCMCLASLSAPISFGRWDRRPAGPPTCNSPSTVESESYLRKNVKLIMTQNVFPGLPRIVFFEIMACMRTNYTLRLRRIALAFLVRKVHTAH